MAALVCCKLLKVRNPFQGSVPVYYCVLQYLAVNTDIEIVEYWVGVGQDWQNIHSWFFFKVSTLKLGTL